MKNLLAVAALMAAAAPVPALADQMSYAFVQLNGIFDAEADLSGVGAPFDGSFDGDGVGFEAGWIYGPYAFSDVRYDDYDFDGDADGHELSARLGVRSKFPLIEPLRLDGYGAISFEDVEFERNVVVGGVPVTAEADDNGFGVHAGLRFAPIKYIEFSGEFSFSDIGDFDGQFLTAGVQWNISEWFALNLRYRTGDYDGSTDIGGVSRDVTLDVDSLRLGARIQWGGG